MVHVTTHADANALLRSPSFISFRRPDVSHFLGGTLIELNGAEHLDRRRLESQHFRPAELRRHERELLEAYLAEFFDECRHHRRDDDGICRTDLVEDALYLLVRIGAALAGFDGIRTADQALRLRQHIDSWGTGTNLEWVDASPEEQETLYRELVETGDIYKRDYFDPAYARRQALIDRYVEGSLASEDLPHDILTTLMLNRQSHWDEDYIFRGMAVYLTGSIRTTQRGLCYAVEEISDWLEQHPSDTEIVTDMEVLKGAVSEALRLRPVIPAIVRRAAEDVTLPSGAVVRSGEGVAILLYETNRDPAAFGDDADTFDPRRAQRLPAAVPSYGYAFGAGAHQCMGKSMATGRRLGDEMTNGTLNTMVYRFFEAGLHRDSERPAIRKPGRFNDEYDTYPIILTNL
jgi:cytochrome P450